MPTPEERALVTDQQDHLIELYVERKDAITAENWGRVSELQSEIEEAKEQLEAIRASAN